MAKLSTSSIFIFLFYCGQSLLAAELDSPANHPISALSRSNDFIQKQTQFEARISSLESQYGSYDSTLLEPLQGLAVLFLETENLSAVQQMISRRLQIIRIQEGPASLSQLAIIAEAIENAIARHSWSEVTEYFETIQWLYFQDSTADSTALLTAMKATSDWHLTAVYLDKPNERMSHFVAYRAINRRLLPLIKSHYKGNDAAIVSWLYRQALEQRRVIDMLRSEDELGAAANEVIFRTELRPISSYSRQALDIMEHIRTAVESSQNLEAQAMAMIYHADFQTLHGFNGSVRLYRQAMEKLREAGISEERIEAFFFRPVVLPVNQIHLTIDRALSQQQTDGYSVSLSHNGSATDIHMGSFIAWNESVPTSRRPAATILASHAQTELNEIWMRFTINSIGKSRIVDITQAQPNTPKVRHNAIDAIKAMQFRPRFIDGKRKRVKDITMIYFYPPPNSR